MLWVKAFHIIAVVCWFAALFYLPRLFVYHASSEDQISRDRFVIMERKLFRGIATPSMIATIVLGIWLSTYNWSYYQGAGWYWTKISLVTILFGYHLLCAKHMRLLKESTENQSEVQHSHIYYRWFNEFPVLILLAVVILVVVKPF